MADFNTGRALVFTAREKGLTFRVSSAGAVHWVGPSGSVTQELLSDLEEGVVDVLAYLRWEEDRMGLLTPLGDVLGDVLAG